MTSKIMLEWVNFVLQPHERKLPINKFGLVIMDNHSTHLDEKVIKRIKDLRYHIKFLPPNTAGRTQPLDIGINKLLKAEYQFIWDNWFEDIILKHSTRGHYMSPSKELMISWIWKSLRKVSREHIQNSWDFYKKLDIPVPERTSKIILWFHYLLFTSLVLSLKPTVLHLT